MCLDYLRVVRVGQNGFVENCGTDTSRNMNTLEFGKINNNTILSLNLIFFFFSTQIALPCPINGREGGEGGKWKTILFMFLFCFFFGGGGGGKEQYVQF